MSYGSIQTIENTDLFIETSGSYIRICIAVKVERGDVQESIQLTEWDIEKIFNEDEQREIKRSEDYHNTIANLYYFNNINYINRVNSEREAV
jgi:hypothetical protein